LAIKTLHSIREFILNVVNFTYQPFRGLIPQETYRYAFTGGLNTAFDIFLYFIVYNFVLDKQVVELGFVAISPHIAAFLFVFPITFTSGFLLAKHITFTSSNIHGRVQLTRYVLTVAGSILLNYILLKFFVEYLHIWPTVSKMLTTVIVVAYSYMAQRYFTFKTGTLPERPPKKP
jgi:putative flippase GtrA